MPDFDEPAWQHVEQESTDELDSIQSRFFDLVTVLGVAPLESNDSICQTDQPAVGDGYSVCVARKIFEDVLRPSEWRFGVDDPLLLS